MDEKKTYKIENEEKRDNSMVVVKERKPNKAGDEYVNRKYVFSDLAICQIFQSIFDEDSAYMKISAGSFNAINLMTGYLASFADEDPVRIYSAGIALYQDEFTEIKW